MINVIHYLFPFMYRHYVVGELLTSIFQIRLLATGCLVNDFLIDWLQPVEKLTFSKNEKVYSIGFFLLNFSLLTYFFSNKQPIINILFYLTSLKQFAYLTSLKANIEVNTFNRLNKLTKKKPTINIHLPITLRRSMKYKY